MHAPLLLLQKMSHKDLVSSTRYHGLFVRSIGCFRSKFRPEIPPRLHKRGRIPPRKRNSRRNSALLGGINSAQKMKFREFRTKNAAFILARLFTVRRKIWKKLLTAWPEFHLGGICKKHFRKSNSTQARRNSSLEFQAEFRLSSFCTSKTPYYY